MIRSRVRSATAPVVRKVMAVLEDGGVDDRDIQTSDFSIGPVCDDRSSAITGYQVSNLVRIHLRDLDSAGSSSTGPPRPPVTTRDAGRLLRLRRHERARRSE